MAKIDLHLHTNYSDGRLSPIELMTLCRQKRYNIISITDHDTIDGYLAVKDIARDYDITLVPGLEISSTHKGAEIHILVYYFDEEDESLLTLLNYINTSRINRAKKIISNLNSIGINLNFDTIFNKIGKARIIGRAHIAREIMNIYPTLSVNRIFDKYLNENSSLYEPKITVNAKEIIPIINKAGGVTVLAHPHRLKNISTVYDIIDFGIDGIEAYCPNSSYYHQSLFLKLADDKGLLTTGGSDFHCEPYEEEDFGNYSVPEKCFDNLVKHYKAAQNQ